MGFPVVHLFYGYNLPLYDWFQSRLFGIGENFNILGLATWTDHLSSAIQYFGLSFLVVLFVNYLRRINASPETILISIAVLLGVPVLLLMVPSQKSELLGNLAILYALSLFALNERQTKLNLFLSIGAIFFAFSIKYSFYVTGFFPFIFIGYNAWRNKLLKNFVLYSLLFYFLLIFPFHMYNLIHYGNPVSPLFAGLFNENGSKELTEYETYLKNFSYNGFKFPLSLLLPASLGSISTILGFGLFTFIFLDYKKRKTIELASLAVMTFLVTLFFVQRTSRFFLDSYYIVMLAFIANPVKRKGFSVFKKLLVLQTAVVAIGAILGVLMLFPGSFTRTLREKTLESCANNYSVMKYLDGVLPEKSFIISDFRDNVYNPRDFIAVNYPFMIKYYPEEFVSRINKLTGFECFYIATRPLDKLNILDETVLLKEPYLKPEKFPLATRNPFNKIGIFYDVFIYKVDPEKLEAIAKSYLSKQ
jgi:hypothetical protein